MEKLIFFLLFALSFSVLLVSCGDDSTAPTNTNTETPLTPGSAYLTFSYAPIGGSAKVWTDSVSLCLKNDSLLLIYKGSGSDTTGVNIYKATGTGNFTLGCQSIIYLKAGGIAGSTCPTGTGTIIVTFFDNNIKTLKATFTNVTLVTITPPFAPVWTISNGTLKCTWP